MKPLFFLTLISFLIVQEISGQYYLEAYDQYMNARRDYLDFLREVRGSPYEHPDFSDAVVSFRSSRPSVKGKLRYNNMFDEMEMAQENSNEFLILIEKADIEKIHFIMLNKTYRYLSYNNRGKHSAGYFNLIQDGTCKLFLRQTREFVPEKEVSAFRDYVPPSVIKKPDLYFVQFGDNPLELIPQSSKRTAGLFKQNGYEVNPFLKKQGIKNNAESLTKLIKYCNQL